MMYVYVKKKGRHNIIILRMNISIYFALLNLFEKENLKNKKKTNVIHDIFHQIRRL